MCLSESLRSSSSNYSYQQHSNDQEEQSVSDCSNILATEYIDLSNDVVKDNEYLTGFSNRGT